MLRKPLVLLNGLEFQLPSSDLLDALSLGVGFEAANTFPTNAVKATPVVMGVNGFSPARANAIGTAFVVGLVAADSIGPSSAGMIQAEGLFSATINQWNVITGLSGGLVPGQSYYLSPNPAGRITTVPPGETGSFLVRLGRAVTPTQMILSIQPPIGL